MKILFLALGILLGSQQAEANNPKVYDGKWVGKGIYLRNGVQAFCPTFEVVFKADGQELEFTSGKRVCESHSEVFDKVTITTKDGGVYWGKSRIGSFDGSLLGLEFRMPEQGGGTRIYRMSMRVEGPNMTYEESRRLLDQDKPVITFAGVLERVEE